MLVSKEIAYFNEQYNCCYDILKDWEVDDVNIRLFTDNLNEIKVICDDGYYNLVAIGKNGKQYYVTL